MYLWGGILLFCGFIMWDTQMIIEKRRRGDKDFIAHSLDLFIDFMQIFRKVLILLMQKVSWIIYEITFDYVFFVKSAKILYCAFFFAFVTGTKGMNDCSKIKILFRISNFGARFGLFWEGFLKSIMLSNIRKSMSSEHCMPGVFLCSSISFCMDFYIQFTIYSKN